MMHQLLHWPDQFDATLWPFALEHAVYIWNHMPRSEHGFSPLKMFTGMKQPSGNKTLLDTRVWGCPAWVLDPTLQDGHKLPKWNKRSCCGVNLGSSPTHSSTVNRILNLNTGFVSPQFHVVYDEHFETVVGALDPERALDPGVWDAILSRGGRVEALDP